MAQIGCLVISDSVNTQEMLKLLKQDKKITIGQEQIAANGTKYISIDKNS